MPLQESAWDSSLTEHLDASTTPALITDAELDLPGPRILYANPAIEALTGYSPDELVGRTPRLFQGPETERAVLDRLRGCLEGGEPFLGWTTNYRKDGTPFLVEWAILPLRDEEDRVIRFLSLQRDVSEEGTQWGGPKAELSKIAENTPGVIYQFRYWPETGHSAIPYASEAHERVFGIPPEAVKEDATPDFERIHPDDLPGLWEGIGESARNLTPWHFQGRVFPAKDETGWGPMEWLEGQSTPEPLPDGSVLWHGHITLITERKRLEEQLERLAYYDPLTGLPNRMLIQDRIGQAVARAKRSGQPFALLYLDLDNFKDINEGLGHEAGDELLVEVGRRLRNSLRGQDTVGRLGGDELVVVAEALRDREAAETVAGKLQATFQAPIQLGDQVVGMQCSIGIALYSEDGSQTQELLRNADAALRYAKSRGGDQWAFFRPELIRQATDRVVVEARLREALDKGEIRVAYQPLVRLSDEAVIGYEALARWYHPWEGWIPPDRFIPVAEANGLIEELGEVVGRTACAEVARWGAEGEALPYLAVNVSPLQIRRPEFAEAILTMHQEAGLPPEKLELEITEQALMELDPTILTRLEEVRGEGVRIAIDDFGTGYASLSYLKHLPVDRLKVDRMFVRDLDRDRGNRAIVAAILTLAREFGLAQTAEGVETPAEAAKLKALGCQSAQGFHFGWPSVPGR